MFYCIEQLVQAIKIAQIVYFYEFIAASVSDATLYFMKGYAVKISHKCTTQKPFWLLYYH